MVPKGHFSSRTLGLYKSCCCIPLESSVPNAQWLFPSIFLKFLIGDPFSFQPDGKTWGMRIWIEHWTCTPKCQKSPRICLVQVLHLLAVAFVPSLRPLEEVMAETHASRVWPRQVQESCRWRTDFPKWRHLLFTHWLFCINHTAGKGFPFVKVIF